jgi:hypothetical protein
MIFIRRDIAIIPKDLIESAKNAQAELELITCPEQRREFIKSKSEIWRAFSQYLSKMSYGKCWYSESDDPQSFFDVDHFRPKNQAKRAECKYDEHGYQWLAFSWENFRYAATKSNRLSTNPETEEVEGKGSWFPLLDGSVCASWNSRCETNEKPVLVDPTVESDVDLIAVHDNGNIVPSRFAKGINANRVTRSAQIYGLNLPNIAGARRRLMREVVSIAQVLDYILVALPDDQFTEQLNSSIDTLKELLRKKTLPQSPFSKAARAVLVSRGMSDLCAQPEHLSVSNDD